MSDEQPDHLRSPKQEQLVTSNVTTLLPMNRTQERSAPAPRRAASLQGAEPTRLAPCTV